MPAPGTLFIVATPIGNLEDITLRALRVLKEVDLVAAEDTRRTLKLLSHFGISKSLVSLRQHNEARESARLISRMLAGASIAYVSDAGTPGIADPGAKLVAAARLAGVPVRPVPGPSAVAAALSISGHSGTEFAFMGFPPAGGSARTAWLDRLASEDRAVVFFEAPHRVAETLGTIGDLLLVNRQIIINRELTKVHETSVIWQNRQDTQTVEKGEFTILILPAEPNPGTAPAAPEVALALVKLLLSSGGLKMDQAIRATEAALGVKAVRIRNLIKKDQILAKQQSGTWP